MTTTTPVTCPWSGRNQRRMALLAWFASLLAAPAAPAQTAAQFEQARKQMVDQVIVGSGVQDPRVVRAMLATPRHEFVAPSLRGQAYYDMSLPIGDRQTISSPYIVAFMTQALDPQPTDKVLEIGTGSGYQAAVLSPLVQAVYTIEIVEPLGHKAERTLKRLQYTNVFVKVGDGFQGWPEHAPFDKIIVTCSPEKVPQPLIDQLREGGLMVVPVGERYQQILYMLRKKNGQLEREALQPTLFVPMTGTAEAQRQVRPDPARPQLVNGDFEAANANPASVPGWYYERQVTWETDPRAPQGRHYVSFANEQPGRAAHLMQGFAVDGQQISTLELSVWVRCEQVRQGQFREELPLANISFFDENRQEVGRAVLGPFRGSIDWRHEAKALRVPLAAREGLVRIGLFGATGRASFDDVQLTPTPRP